VWCVEVRFIDDIAWRKCGVSVFEAARLAYGELTSSNLVVEVRVWVMRDEDTG